MNNDIKKFVKNYRKNLIIKKKRDFFVFVI